MHSQIWQFLYSSAMYEVLKNQSYENMKMIFHSQFPFLAEKKKLLTVIFVSNSGALIVLVPFFTYALAKVQNKNLVL